MELRSHGRLSGVFMRLWEKCSSRKCSAWIFGDNIARYLSLILENDFRRLSKMFINRIYYTSIEFNIFLNVYNIFALIEFII